MKSVKSFFIQMLNFVFCIFSSSEFLNEIGIINFAFVPWNRSLLLE